jgi:putative ABC transport system permease protein
VQTFFGILGGLVLGKLFVIGLVNSFETDTYRMPAFVASNTYAFSALVVGIASIASGLVVRREIARLDLVSVLKTRE